MSVACLGQCRPWHRILTCTARWRRRPVRSISLHQSYTQLSRLQANICTKQSSSLHPLLRRTRIHDANAVSVGTASWKALLMNSSMLSGVPARKLRWHVLMLPRRSRPLSIQQGLHYHAIDCRPSSPRLQRVVLSCLLPRHGACEASPPTCPPRALRRLHQPLQTLPSTSLVSLVAPGAF